METSYMPNMGPAPFYYYNTDSIHDQRQQGHFTHYPSGIPFFPQIVKNPCANDAYLHHYPPPDASMVFQHGFFPQQRVLTPLTSPQSIGHRPPPLVDHRQSPYLHQLDTDCSPSTPPLSVSGSARSSPPASSALLQTPSNGSFVFSEPFRGFKHGLNRGPPEMLPQGDFISPSPPLTPVFVFPTPAPTRTTTVHLVQNASANYPVSPAPSPLPLSTTKSEPAVSFCDPRQLVVHSPALSTERPTPVSRASATCEELKNLSPPVKTEATFEFLSAPAPDFLGTCDSFYGLDFDHDFSTFSKSGISDNSFFGGHERQRPELVAFTPEEENFITEDAFSETDEDHLASAWLLTPSDLEHSFSSDMSRSATTSTHNPATSSIEVDSDADYSGNGCADNGHGNANQTSSNGVEGNRSASDALTSGSDGFGNSASQSINRRGRKQSLTDDPSKTFICHLCNRRFRRQEHLKRHYRSLHTHDKPFRCGDCGKTFSRSDNLAQHQRTHGTGTISLEINGMTDGEGHDHQQPASPDSESDRMAQILYHAAQRLAATTSESSASSTEESDVSISAAAGEKKARKRKRDD